MGCGSCADGELGCCECRCGQGKNECENDGKNLLHVGFPFQKFKYAYFNWIAPPEILWMYMRALVIFIIKKKQGTSFRLLLPFYSPVFSFISPVRKTIQRSEHSEACACTSGTCTYPSSCFQKWPRTSLWLLLSKSDLSFVDCGYYINRLHACQAPFKNFTDCTKL